MAIEFDGNDQRISIGDVAYTKTPPFTVAFWVKFNSLVSAGLVTKYAVASWNGFNVFQQSSHILAWFLRDGNNYVAIAAEGGVGEISGYPVEAGMWYHIAVTVECATPGMKMYAGGSLYTTANWVGICGDTTESSPLVFGNYSVRYLDGLLDDIAIWDVALTQNEINSLAKSKRRLPLSVRGDHIVGYWRLDGPNGAVAAGANSVLDLSGNGNHGTPYNDPVYRGSILTYPE